MTANFSDGRSEVVSGIANLDAAHDLVLLAVRTAGVKPLAFGPIPPLGADVVAIGNPEGYSGTISTGIVSGVRTVYLTRVVQTTAPISPGSSGGALLNGQGRVVGVTSMGNIQGQNLNFAVVADYVRLLIPTEEQPIVAFDRLSPPSSQPPASTQSPTSQGQLAIPPASSTSAQTSTPVSVVLQPPTPEAIKAATSSLLALWHMAEHGFAFTGTSAQVK